MLRLSQEQPYMSAGEYDYDWMLKQNEHIKINTYPVWLSKDGKQIGDSLLISEEEMMNPKIKEIYDLLFDELGKLRK